MTKRSHREVLREKAECLQKKRREHAQHSTAKALAVEAAVRASLHKGPDILRFFEARFREDAQCLAFIHEVHERAPKLATREYGEPFRHLSKAARVRELVDWKPSGKGRDSIFRSLCAHLFSKYETPPFLWSAFFQDNTALTSAVVEIARGGSLFKLCKEGSFPVPLTRAQCHDFLQAPAELSFMTALRRIQVKAEGGDQRLLTSWMKVREAATLGTTETEAFWATVLRFFARAPMLDAVQMGPLCDYIRFRHRDPRFSMQGRTATALLREMHEWHGDLAKIKKADKAIFAPSGFSPLSVDKSVTKNGFTTPEVWTVSEILSSADLLAEGKALRHCVYSYSWRISDRTTSVWSLTCMDFTGIHRKVTIELQNLSRTIVQARGLANRFPTPQEDKIILAWATENALTARHSFAW